MRKRDKYALRVKLIGQTKEEYGGYKTYVVTSGEYEAVISSNKNGVLTQDIITFGKLQRYSSYERQKNNRGRVRQVARQKQS